MAHNARDQNDRLTEEAALSARLRRLGEQLGSIVSNSSRPLLPSLRMTRIELGDALANGDVELFDREEAPVVQPRQYESLNDLHRHFRFCLVARLSDPWSI
jgi:hypothetical protein